MRHLLASLAATAALTLSCAAAEIPASALVDKGTLTYGVAASFAPFEFMKDGKPAGFDIDLAEALGKKLGLQPKAMAMDFGGLIPALSGKRMDVINSAMYINPKRAEQVDFVPYLKIGNEVVVAKGNPAKITGRDDSLCGKSIAVTLGAIEETYARADSARCEAAHHSAVKVLTFPTAQDAALNLRQGRADAFFDSTPGVVELTAAVPDVYEVAGPEFESGTQIGMAVRKGDKPMQDGVTNALKAIVADGTYKALIAKWKLPASVSLFD
jgi:polar amino acid transport system substrate-binding protein